MCIIKTYREEKMRKLNNKHIFVSFEPGGAEGYKLARVLATMPCMHWYSCEENGIMPWNITNTTNQNKHHFDRITPKGILPPTHDYVEKYMPNEKQYYKLFDELFAANGGEDIINDGKRVIYCTHSMPNKILEYFPNSLIFNIIHKPDDTTEKYLDIATSTSGYIEHDGVVPELNEYLQFLKILQRRKEDLTIADVWAFERKKKFYDPSMEDKLRKEVYAKMFSSNIFRKAVNHERVYNLSGKADWFSIKNWLDIKLGS
tara:strand:- start:123 stop:899 length:777 start_codon:yes stop_codon:yes gene_type:complete